MPDSVRFSGGRIWTGRRYVEALLVEGGQVVAAGRDSEVRRARPAGTEDHGLRGRLMIPGLVDAHLHLADLTRLREGLDLRRVTSLAGLQREVAAWAEAHPRGTIVGRGWDQERMGGAVPSRSDLDAVTKDRPILLYHASGHLAVANGRALELAGYGPGAAPPKGGRLGRAPDGSWDGRVYERALEPFGAFGRGAETLPPDALARTLQILGQYGITSVCTVSTDPVELRALASLADRIRLTVRVRAYPLARLLPMFTADELRRPAPDARLGVWGAKLFVDGAFGPRTAWLSEPYADRPEESGEATLAGPDLDRTLGDVRQRGLVPAVHAIGDRAVEEVERALEGAPVPEGPPPRIEHLGLVPPGLQDRLARRRPTLVVQPGFVWTDGWLAERLGPDRARWAYPFRSLTDRGLVLVGSSDAPFDEPDPWRGLRAAVRRTGPDGRSANPAPEEALDPEAALRLYTTNAGVGLGDPGWGSLEVGAPADLVIHTATDVAGAIASGAAGVDETWAEGVPVYLRR
jgi:predicted amidohydrolase YtcJ